MVVGAYQEDTGGNSAGSAYIFHCTGENTWDTGVKIQSSDIEVSDFFGYSVSISEGCTIIGAYGEDTGGGMAGSAYILKYE